MSEPTNSTRTSDAVFCVRKVWTDIWHPHRCNKPAKYLADEGGPVRVPLCGVHARQAKRLDYEVAPIEVQK